MSFQRFYLFFFTAPLVVFILFAFNTSRADEVSIIDVRRNITLADNDPVYKDFYLNAGSEKGLKKNQILTMIRKINVKDSSGSQVVGEMKVPVGQLKVIAVYNKVAVAREQKLFSRDDLPMLEQIGLMIGDKVDAEN